jgi:hypothetical protein
MQRQSRRVPSPSSSRHVMHGLLLLTVPGAGVAAYAARGHVGGAVSAKLMRSSLHHPLREAPPHGCPLPPSCSERVSSVPSFLTSCNESRLGGTRTDGRACMQSVHGAALKASGQRPSTPPLHRQAELHVPARQASSINHRPASGRHSLTHSLTLTRTHHRQSVGRHVAGIRPSVRPRKRESMHL